MHPTPVLYIPIFLHVRPNPFVPDLHCLREQDSILSCYLISIHLSIPIPYHSSTGCPESDPVLQKTPFVEMAPLTYRNRNELFEEAFDDVCIDTGTWYPCTQYSLDVSGGLNRQVGGMPPAALRNIWFEHHNPG